MKDFLSDSDDEEIDQLKGDDLSTLRSEASSTTSMSPRFSMTGSTVYYSNPGQPMNVDDTVLLCTSLKELVNNTTIEERQISYALTRKSESLHKGQGEQDQVTFAVLTESFYVAFTSTIKAYENQKRPLKNPLSNDQLYPFYVLIETQGSKKDHDDQVIYYMFDLILFENKIIFIETRGVVGNFIGKRHLQRWSFGTR